MALAAGRRPVAAAGAVGLAALLLAIVAIGISPGVAGDHSRLDPSAVSAAFSVIFTLVAISIAALTGVVLWHLFSDLGRGHWGTTTRQLLREIVAGAVAVAVAVGMFSLFFLLPRRHGAPSGRGSGGVVTPKSIPPHHGPGIPYNWTYGGSTIIVVLAIAAALLLALHLRRARARGRHPRLDWDELLGTQVIAEAELVTSLASVSVADPLTEPDPRRAIVQAWLAMTDVLARLARPRRPSEAPQEYLQAVLMAAGAGGESAATLTSLFEEARFSHHPVGEDKRRQAMSALDQVRGELGLGRRVSGT